jgi:type VI secretion system protein VasG
MIRKLRRSTPRLRQSRAEIAELTARWQKELDLVNQILKLRHDLGLSLEGDEPAAEEEASSEDAEDDSDTPMKRRPRQATATRPAAADDGQLTSKP